MSVKLAQLIKDARTKAGLTQQELASMVPGLTVSEISKAEHNEIELTEEELRGIAKATGVTQKSLVEAASAAKTGTAKTSTAKTGTAKTNTAKTGTAKTSTAKTGTSTGKTSAAKTSTAKTSTAATTTMKLTNAEKKLVELYRQADSETKKSALKILKGEESEINEILSSILGGAVGSFLKK